jgi:membrane associated rhomboid family serine protease
LQRYFAAALVASKMFCGSFLPSPLPSVAYEAHVGGMNCIGPIAFP